MSKGLFKKRIQDWRNKTEVEDEFTEEEKAGRDFAITEIEKILDEADAEFNEICKIHKIEPKDGENWFEFNCRDLASFLTKVIDWKIKRFGEVKKESET